MTETAPKAISVVALALAAVFTPPAPLVPSAWAKENFVVPDGPRAGKKWDDSLTPYVGPFLDTLTPDTPHNRAVMRKSAQTGLSVGGLAWVAGLIDRAPARMAYVLPTIDALHEFNREKLTPVLEQTPAMVEKVKAQIKRSGSGSTARSKRFAGGSLILINANSAADLRMKTLKYAVADEVDEWPRDLDGQGDPWAMLEARFIAFHASGDWKLLEISTPTLAGSSRIDADFEAGDQRFWHMPCPHCGSRIRFQFENLKFNPKPPHEAHYVCQANGCVIEHYGKASMVRAGEFIATNADDGLWPSFHIDALTSLLTTWDNIAKAYTDARGDPKKEMAFYNLWLGLAFEMRGDAPDHVRLYERREEYPSGTVPARGLIFVAGCDVQHSGIWAELTAFAPNRESWTISARWIEGDTTDPDAGAFAALAELIEEAFPTEQGGVRTLDAVAIDAGDGGRSNQVYAFARGRPKVYAIKGASGWSTPSIGTPTKVDIKLKGKKVRRGVSLWPVGTWSLKAEFYANLRKNGVSSGAVEDPAGYCHHNKDLDENYFKQITAEYLADEVRNGRSQRVWRESGPNHLLDCRIYAMAIADHLGLRRNTKQKWLDLARKYGLPDDTVSEPVTPPEEVVTEAKPQQTLAKGTQMPSADVTETKPHQPPVTDDAVRRAERRKAWARR